MTKVKKIVAGVATVAGVLAFSGQAAHADATPAKTATPATGEQTKQDTLAEQVEKAPNVVAAKDNAAKAGQTTTAAQSTATDAQTQAATATDQNQTATQAQNAAQAKVDAAQKLVDQTSAAQQVAQTAKDQAAATAAAQDGVVKTDQAAVDAATQKQQDAQTAYDKVQQAAQNATPTNVQTTKDQITQTTAKIAKDKTTEQTDQAAIDKAKTAQQAAQSTATKAAQTAQTDQAATESAQNQVAQVNQQVAQDNAALANQQTAISASNAAAQTAKEAITTDQNNIAETKTAVTKNAADLADAQAALKAAQDSAATLTQALSDRQIAQIAVDVNEAQIDRYNSLKSTTVANTITLPTGYKEALANIATAMNKVEMDQLNHVAADELAADQVAVTTAIQAGTPALTQAVTGNVYHGNSYDQQITFSDIAALTGQQRNELSMFTADMVNQIRTALGNTTTAVTQGAVDFANDIATQYNQDNWNLSQKHAHDVAAITKVAGDAKYGLNADDNYYESLGNGYVNIAPDSTGKIAGNMDQLKEAVYNTIRDMMLKDQDSSFGHALALAGQYEPTAASYLGTSFDKLGQDHFEIVTDTPAYIPTNAKFNRDVMSLAGIPTPGVTDKALDANYRPLSIAESNTQNILALAKRTINTNKEAESNLTAAQNKVDEVQAVATKLSTTLTTQQAQLVTDTDAQTKANNDVITQ